VCWVYTLFRRGSFGLRILIAVVTIGIFLSAWSDTEAHRQAAEQVLKLTRVHRMLEPMIRQMQQRQLRQLEEMSLPKEAYVITEKYIRRMNELLKAELAWDKIEDDNINLYASVFSEKELGELVLISLQKPTEDLSSLLFSLGRTPSFFKFCLAILNYIKYSRFLS